MIHSPQGKSPHLRASPGCWPLSPRFPGQVLPCSSWQALAAVQKRQKGGTQPAPLSAASSSYSQGQLPLTVSSQQAMRACLRFKDHIESNKCTSSCIVGLPGGAVQCCRDLPIPLPRLPNVGKDDHVQHPLDGAIIHALDPGDFVCLILQDIVPAAASRHGDRLVLFRLDLG